MMAGASDPSDMSSSCSDSSSWAATPGGGASDDRGYYGSCDDDDDELSDFLWNAFASEETAGHRHLPIPLHPPPQQPNHGTDGVGYFHDPALLCPLFHPDPELDALCT
jgi:hypothetical protein